VPVEVNITDSEGKVNEYSGYFTITEGKVEIPLALALDDPEGKWKMSVKNLCDKNVVVYEFNVERNNEK
jgi:hypothetical protein